jgi:hypothetical protein
VSGCGRFVNINDAYGLPDVHGETDAAAVHGFLYTQAGVHERVLLGLNQSQN